MGIHRNVCEVCGAVFEEEWCPICGNPAKEKFGHQAQPKEAWKDIKHLAGLMDADGSFPIVIIYDKRVKRHYLDPRVSIGIKDSPYWKEVVEYWHGIYGGSVVTYTKVKDIIRVWVISAYLDILLVTLDLVPYLKLRKEDALILRTFVLRWIPYHPKGQPTRKMAEELKEKLSLPPYYPSLVKPPKIYM